MADTIPYFSADSLVHLACNLLIPIKDIKPDYCVKTETGNACVKYVVCYLCDDTMCDFVIFDSTGLRVSPNCRIKSDGWFWERASDSRKARSQWADSVYNLVLDTGDTIIVNNTVCSTLGSLNDTPHLADDLKILDGGRNKVITISSVYLATDDGAPRIRRPPYI